MRWFYAANLVLLLATSSVAAPPKVPGAVTLRPGEISSVEIQAEAGKEVAWGLGFAPESCFVDEGRALRKDTARLIVSPRVSGTYRIVVWTVGEKESATLIIDATGAAPDPLPTPRPRPDPPNPAPAARLFIVIVEDTADAVAARGAMLADPTLAGRCKDKGHKWRVVDRDVVDASRQPPADVKRFLDAAKGRTYPQLFLVNEKGETVLSGDLPKTAAGLVELLKKAGG